MTVAPTSRPGAAAAPETATLSRAEGTSFTLRIHPASDPAAPLLLVLPAMGVQAGYYVRLAAALNEAGCNVAVSEQRGHEEAGGRTPGRDYDFGYHELLTEDVPLAVDAAAARFPDAPLYLLGHSLGGQIGAIYAARHPDRLAGLILVAVSSVHWRLWPWPFLFFSQFVVLVARLLGHFPGRRFGFAGREARTLMADWGRQARTGHFVFGPGRTDHDRALATLRLPVLAVSLEGDFFAPRHAMDGLLAKLPDAGLTRHHLDPEAMGFDNVDHLRWARQPQVVVPTILEWLEAQRRGRA